MRHRCVLVLLSALVAVVLFAPAHALNVSGTTNTTTWTAANSAYHVTGAITVPTASTLTIEPGVDVVFDADVQFVIQGALHAVGTETDSIRFIKGTAAEWGGIRISGGDSSTISFARLSGGHAHGVAPSYRGGALCVSGSDLAIYHSNITGNTALYNGGGIASLERSAVSLAYCVIEGNQVTGGASGGGLYSESSSITMEHCEISRNSVLADGPGGGVSTESSAAALANCVIAGNTAYAGGGIFSSILSTTTLTNCTIIGNAAYGDTSGGARVSAGASVTMTDCILWSDSPDEIHVSSGTVAATFSDIQGAYAGTGNIDADPLFVDAANGDYTLQAGSPCIDAGDPESAPDPDGTRADIGAAFWQAPYGDASRNGSVTALDASLVLQSVVGLVTPVPEFYADVSGNGYTSGYDAWWILRKTTDPELLFPVEGGSAARPATAAAPLALTWVATDDGWSLVADGRGVMDGQMTFALPSDAAVVASGPAISPRSGKA